MGATTKNPILAAAEALSLQSLITPTEQGIASRVLARTSGGNVTLFAFDAGQGLTEHTSPYDALLLVPERPTAHRRRPFQPKFRTDPIHLV